MSKLNIILAAFRVVTSLIEALQEDDQQKVDEILASPLKLTLAKEWADMQATEKFGPSKPSPR